MNSKYFKSAWLAVAAASAQPLWAADFSVTVPVQASGLPAAVNELVVSCQILTDENSIVVGAKAVYVPVKGASFRGDVLVPVDASGGVNPSSATRYRCMAWFTSPGPSGKIFYYSDNAPDGRRLQRFPLAEGAPFKLDTGYQPLPR